MTTTPPYTYAYWSHGWELRQLEWLRWHGLWKPSAPEQKGTRR